MIRKGISVVFLVLLLFLALIGVFVCVTLAIRWTKRQTGDFVAAASEAIAIVGEDRINRDLSVVFNQETADEGHLNSCDIKRLRLDALLELADRLDVSAGLWPAHADGHPRLLLLRIGYHEESHMLVFFPADDNLEDVSQGFGALFDENPSGRQFFWVGRRIGLYGPFFMTPYARGWRN